MFLNGSFRRFAACSVRVGRFGCSQGACPMFNEYHSKAVDMEQPYYGKKKELLQNALHHVPELGFTNEALARGAQDSGYTSLPAVLFPRGGLDLFDFFHYVQRKALHELKPHLSTIPSMKERIIELLWARLYANRDVNRHLPSILALSSRPLNIRHSLKTLGLLANEILFLAQDSSNDFQWYTKRAAVASIYGLSELYMTRDTSPDFGDTYRFVSHRMDHAASLNSIRREIGSWLTFQSRAVSNIMRSKGF
ncbi:ubiquinone biosynthesis protein Coq9 [Schizosaccharomyces japonicus yFS275]|uniref:Ubiquinone biosynthesis protein n=1 Tax=Schizosaccharomyces japonicus (strain yFS275 / FY16936) TaxID=402676 RepID=B6JZ42_SCHJY|nr:ubiquinone biosynthesis protein Coq9 [Schizosaccharomyces japonicus yFS275]EEB06810.1 ubiquinone biosynthesis protein Coq9 [Schizosaccharomyces japonicus yFS275]